MGAAVTHADQVSLTVSGQSTFESQPTLSRADTSHLTKSAEMADNDRSVFESEPSKSKAAVTHADQVSGTVSGQSTFESNPAKSTAAVTHADVVRETDRGAAPSAA